MHRDTTEAPVRPLLRKLANDARTGKLSRREFLSLATSFGASAGAAYGLLGLALPAPGFAGTPRRGGILRVGSMVLNITDPRKFSRSEQGNIARAFCETLARWEGDATLAPMLLERWHISDDARTYTLFLRQGVTWTNGDTFIADDVIHNLKRWCDRSAEGNSMASRMSALVDPVTGHMANGAIERVDDFTVRLNLLRPDITLIAGMVDYPALIVHRSFGEDGDLSKTPVGTGPFELESLEIRRQARLRRRTNGAWWGGEAYLDELHFVDLGQDATAIAAAFDAGDIEANDDTPSDFVGVFDSLGLVRQSRLSANTIVARMRVDTPPYDDPRLRQAVQLSVNNDVVLALGHNNDGLAAENHHVAPIHPEYAALPKIKADPERAFAMARAAGHADTQIELISIDGDWRTTTSDAIAAQIRQAGFNVKRTIIAGESFWNAWKSYPFSTTSWGGRPLGLQVYALAYRSGAAWNETGFSDPEFDALLDSALGIVEVDARSELSGRLQTILRDSSVIIQPYWRNQTLHHVEKVKNFSREKFRELHFEEVWLEE